MAALEDFVTSPPTCIFCGTDQGPFDPEDVFPKWLRRVLPEGALSGGRHYRHRAVGARAGKQPRADNAIRLVLDKAVCRRCNNNWMGDLEKRIKRTLAGAMVGRSSLRLTPIQQQDVARWVVQKSLLIQLAYCQAEMIDKPDYVTHAHLHWLFAHRKTRHLPPVTGVWLFPNMVRTRTTPEGPRSTLNMSTAVRIRTYSKDFSTDENLNPVVGVLFTFTIAFLGFQAFVCDFGNEVRELPPPPPPQEVTACLTQIAPVVTGTAKWPRPRFVEGPDAFTDLAHWRDPTAASEAHKAAHQASEAAAGEEAPDRAH